MKKKFFTEFYFAAFDDQFGSSGYLHPHQQPSNSSPAGGRRPDFLNTFRQSWRRSQLSRENSNESSLSCHSEGAVSISSSGQGSSGNKILKVRDPLHVRGGAFNEQRSRSAGRLEDGKDSV